MSFGRLLLRSEATGEPSVQCCASFLSPPCAHCARPIRTPRSSPSSGSALSDVLPFPARPVENIPTFQASVGMMFSLLLLLSAQGSVVSARPQSFCQRRGHQVDHVGARHSQLTVPPFRLLHSRGQDSAVQDGGCADALILHANWRIENAAMFDFEPVERWEELGTTTTADGRRMFDLELDKSWEELGTTTADGQRDW